MTSLEIEKFKKDLELKKGKVYSTNELQENFEVENFCMGFVIVERKEDNKKGYMDFTHRPRFYYGFKEVNL